MAALVIRKRCYAFAAAARQTHYFLRPFSIASPPPATPEQKCPPPKKPAKAASQPKYPRPSTPLSKLGQSRSSRHAEAAAQRAAGQNPEEERREQLKKFRKEKKKKRETPKFEGLTVSRPVHSDLPFAFRYSYTEVPKAQPIRFQERYSPFGPGRLDRPWDGQEALPVKVPSRRVKRKDDRRKHVIDSFKPPSKKGIKPVAPPGPFLLGTGPKKAKTREEIIGEPLTKEETDMLVQESMRSEKQLNIGRDGLTHNLLICFYDYWTRERMVRVKCMGVATVDMDNIVFHIEDKTGGKVIYRAGGTLHVFRGRYYNNKDRPNIPRMLWRPHSPVYPKLVTETPGGLKRSAANALRKRGRGILPLCRLAKNGFYGDLVANVREAFQEDDLVRIDCKAVNRPDYKKIGAKLRDLVPCVILSFQEDQILLWKGKERVRRMTKELPGSEVGTINPINGDTVSEKLGTGEATNAISDDQDHRCQDDECYGSKVHDGYDGAAGSCEDAAISADEDDECYASDIDDKVADDQGDEGDDDDCYASGIHNGDTGSCEDTADAGSAEEYDVEDTADDADESEASDINDGASDEQKDEEEDNDFYASGIEEGTAGSSEDTTDAFSAERGR